MKGVKISYKFLPFVNTRSQDVMAPVSPKTEVNTVPSDNNVAERYLHNSSPVLDENCIPTDRHEKTNSPLITQKNKQYAPTEALKIVSGSVTECTLLQAQFVCKVKVSLK